MSGNKDCRIAIRLSEELNDEILKTVELFKTKMKVEVNKTNIVTSAIAEGLKVLQKRVNDGE